MFHCFFETFEKVAFFPKTKQDVIISQWGMQTPGGGGWVVHKLSSQGPVVSVTYKEN